MRAVQLGKILKYDLWKTADFTKTSEAMRLEATNNWNLGKDRETCSTFVSHAWQDNGVRKVDMMRSFLSVQKLVARLLVCCVLLALFCIPLFSAVGVVSAETLRIRAEYKCVRENECVDVDLDLERFLMEWLWIVPSLVVSVLLLGLLGSG